MFTKDDFIEYFKQISEIENQMLINISELTALIEEESILLLLKRIKNDEIRHMSQLITIREIINSKD